MTTQDQDELGNPDCRDWKEKVQGFEISLQLAEARADEGWRQVAALHNKCTELENQVDILQESLLRADRKLIFCERQYKVKVVQLDNRLCKKHQEEGGQFGYLLDSERTPNGGGCAVCIIKRMDCENELKDIKLAEYNFKLKNAWRERDSALEDLSKANREIGRLESQAIKLSDFPILGKHSLEASICIAQDTKTSKAIVDWLDKPCKEHPKRCADEDGCMTAYQIPHRKDCPQCWQALQKGKAP